MADSCPIDPPLPSFCTFQLSSREILPSPAFWTKKNYSLLRTVLGDIFCFSVFFCVVITFAFQLKSPSEVVFTLNGLLDEQKDHDKTTAAYGNIPAPCHTQCTHIVILLASRSIHGRFHHQRTSSTSRITKLQYTATQFIFFPSLSFSSSAHESFLLTLNSLLGKAVVTGTVPSPSRYVLAYFIPHP